MDENTLEQLTRRLERRVPDFPGEELARELLRSAVDWMLSVTGREALPSNLESACLRLAVVWYNRMGMEGESRHGEGQLVWEGEGVPEDILREVNPYRLARTVTR